MAASPWLFPLRDRPEAHCRLIGVPHAGGGVLAFRRWPERLTGLAVFAAQLPGRDGRRHEPPARSIEELADGLSKAIRTDSRPVALFGHSMGALVAFETARRLEAASHPLRGLIVSGRPAPTCAERLPPIAGLEPAAFISAIQSRYAGIPEAVLHDDELLELFAPQLQSDVGLVERYRYTPSLPLATDVLIMAGTADPRTLPEELEAWRRQTRGRSRVVMASGGHFFIESSQETVLGVIAAFLAPKTSLTAALASP